MDAILVTVALISLAMALTMGLASWQLLREQRRRSLARVAALVRASSAESATKETCIASDTRLTRPSHVVSVEHRTQPTTRISERIPRAADRDPFASKLPEASVEHVLFGSETTGPPPIWPRRFVAIVAFGGLVMMGASAALLPFDRRAAGVPEALSSAESAGPPIELVSLRHTRQGDVLSIIGLVRTAPTGRPARYVTVVASLFDRGGSLLAAGQTTLDFATTGARENSPFVINIPVAGAVGRYRVGFRTERGAVVPHIDRRGIPTAGDKS